jgi:hypothetical protein
MVLAAVNRFGTCLAGARGRWRWLIAALVASLVSVPFASAAVSIKQAPVVGGHHRGPTARPAFLGLTAGTLAIAIVQKIGEGALQKVGNAGFGWVLDQFGLGDGQATEIAGIRDQLGEIQTGLSEIRAATSQLRTELAEGTYSGLVAQTSGITARIDKGADDLDAVARMTAGEPTKKRFTEATLKFIDDNLMQGQQEELALRISGEAGADGLIVAASKVAKTQSPCCWTDLKTKQVREVFNYYQLEEARLLLLRVEYMHANPKTYSEAEITRQIDKVRLEIGQADTPGTQEALLKPSPPCCITATYPKRFLPENLTNPEIAEPDSDLIWNTAYLGAQIPANESLYLQRWEYAAGGWRIPTAAEIKHLITGWSGPNWAKWLNNEAGGQIGSLSYVSVGPSGPRPFGGVWTYTTPTLCATCRSPIGIEFNALSAVGVEERGDLEDFAAQRKGVLLVKTRTPTETFWW